ncbi:ABC transporter permease [Chloroflexi bacterium TSY]|nr:ABC transporter permease [Chloroflexi bacterium TSY]
MSNVSKHLTTDAIKTQQRINLWKHRQGIIGGLLVLVFTLMALFGTWLAPHDPVAVDFSKPFAKPIWLDPVDGAGLMGRDNLGRDVYSRVLIGSRISLLVGAAAVIIGLVLGISLGLIAGYRGGLLGDIIMRIADTQTAIPFLVLLIAAVAFVGSGILNIIIFLGIGAWVGFARLVRGEVLSIRERDYVEAARALGVSDIRIMFRHILPNAVAPVIVAATLSFGSMILTESALSFLGLGISSLVPTWGKMVADARDYVTTTWYPSLSRSKFGVFGYFQSRLQGFWSHLFRFRLQKTTYFISENRPNLTQKLDIDRQICIYVNCLARILSQNLKFGSTETSILPIQS